MLSTAPWTHPRIVNGVLHPDGRRLLAVGTLGDLSATYPDAPRAVALA